ncbi:hypothetical protein BIU82_00270 [Arthrobacter sp. SW1]|nr:hypothetical protein BIU82_00270 [Arthrobacter sp. SW1]
MEPVGERIERLRQSAGRADVVLVIGVDEDFLEDGEVQEPAEVVGEGHVGLVAVFEEIEDLGQVGFRCGGLVGEAG